MAGAMIIRLFAVDTTRTCYDMLAVGDGLVQGWPSGEIA